MSSRPRPLLQETASDRWEILLACVLLNRTQREQVDRVWADLRRGWPGSRAIANADRRGLEAMLQPLGFATTRARRLQELARQVERRGGLEDLTAEGVLDLPGCGQYAADAWAIFVEGNFAVDPLDEVLAMRARELRAEREAGGVMATDGL